MPISAVDQDHGGTPVASSPPSQSTLVEVERSNHSAVAKSLHRLEAAGFVSRERSPQHRRAIIVSLTAEGRAMHKKVQAAWRRLEAVTVLTLEARERATLPALVKRVERAVADAATTG